MAEAAQPGGEAEGAKVAVQQPAGRRAAARRGRRSVLQVSQLLLRAITAHRHLTTAALRRELESAGYEVRRTTDRRAGGPGGPETKGTLLRVSGIDAAGYFTVWKLRKSKRKAGRSRQALDRGSSKRPACRTSRPRRRRSCRQAARKAREGWRRDAKALKAKARKTRSSAKSRLKDHTRIPAKARVRAKPKDEAPARARDQARAKARDQAFAKARNKAHAGTKAQALARVREEACARVTDESTDQASKEDSRPRSKDERRRSSKLREEKKQEPEKRLKRTIPKPAVTKAHRASSGRVKARTKTSTKSEGPGSTKGKP